MAWVYMGNISPELTENELEEIAMAETMPIVFDKDCPKMTEDMLKQFRRMDKVGIKISSAIMEKGEGF